MLLALFPVSRPNNPRKESFARYVEMIELLQMQKFTVIEVPDMHPAYMQEHR